MARPYDRPTNEPGGMECMDCGIIFIGAEWHYQCAVCYARTVSARKPGLSTDTNREQNLGKSTNGHETNGR